MLRNLNHLLISGFTTNISYTYPLSPRDKFDIVDRDRVVHGNRIQHQFERAVQDFEIKYNSDFVYIEFTSEFNVLLAFDSFDDGRNGDFRFVSSKLEKINHEGLEHIQYRACVYLNKKGVSKFLKKIENYLNPEKDSTSGNPRNQKLINNISEIKDATLKSFWHEPEMEFPSTEDNIWWEIWFTRTNFNEDTFEENESLELLPNSAIISENRIIFPEHIIRLIKTNPTTLSNVILYSDKLAELRHPKETVEYFTSLDNSESHEYSNDLNSRIINRTSENSTQITILDTGVNREHPLIRNFLPPQNMDSVNPVWGSADTTRHGHGTLMAGIALYGDLIDVIENQSSIEISHSLESIKLINPNAPHHPYLYGAITQEAVARANILNPDNNRVFVMAITAKDDRDKGKPSSWSSNIDQICFGDSGLDEGKYLYCISGGNVNPLTVLDYRYPQVNFNSSVQDPAQSFNSLTVGTYTNKSRINEALYRDAELIAPAGGMSPNNSTSLFWDKDWPIKPEIVMEGGNYAWKYGEVIDPESLLLLSTSNNFNSSQFDTFCATSAAAAQASRYSAIMLNKYPNLWPESVKGLLIHSANWTNQMLRNRSIDDMNMSEKKTLLRTVGYGVPNLQSALNSANNSLTLISQETLQPFHKENNTIKSNEMHLHELPWPKEVLESLFDTEVTLKVTLSYFIEPNPGNKRYSKSYSYKSHSLRFKMINANESTEKFLERVNKESRNSESDSSYQGEAWSIGFQVRDKGSIHKDFWKGTAADLSTRNKIAIYPVGGWWKTRKKLNRYDNQIRYSLIISIDTEDTDINLYTPILNQLEVLI